MQQNHQEASLIEEIRVANSVQWRQKTLRLWMWEESIPNHWINQDLKASKRINIVFKIRICQTIIKKNLLKANIHMKLSQFWLHQLTLNCQHSRAMGWEACSISIRCRWQISITLQRTQITWFRSYNQSKRRAQLKILKKSLLLVRSLSLLSLTQLLHSKIWHKKLMKLLTAPIKSERSLQLFRMIKAVLIHRPSSKHHNQI